MTSWKPVHSHEAPTPASPLSQGASADGFVFTSGSVAFDPESGEIVGDTIEEQTRQTISNVSAILEAAGATLADVVSVMVHLADIRADFAGFNRAYSLHFADPPPARTTVGATLAREGLLVEIGVVAVKRSPDQGPRLSQS